LRFWVSARDSFCNWGYDSCSLPPTCRPAWAEIICGPCEAYTGCYDQIVQFTITDLDYFDIDTMRTYLTMRVYHTDATADTFYIDEPSDSLRFECVAGECSHVILTVEGFEFETGDYIIIQLDSLYNEHGCFTIPGE